MAGAGEGAEAAGGAADSTPGHSHKAMQQGLHNGQMEHMQLQSTEEDVWCRIRQALP